MSLYGVTSPAQLTKDEKSRFFTEVRQDWASYKLLRVQSKVDIPITPSPVEESIPIPPTTEKKKNISEEEKPQKQSKQIIRSEPNEAQTNDLRILYKPNSIFAQEGQYLYPVVIMPVLNSILKLPRTGRSNQKGYKEDDFFDLLKNNIRDIEMTNNVHMVIPHFNKPYEPDIVLFDEILNLYIDIEIDEPYDGYYRYPTHYINPEDDTKQDNTRDLFFTESGWIVIRFTERQVHCQALECIDYVKNVLNSLYNRPVSNEIICQQENQWDYNQCIQWQKSYFRERYLGIERFHKQYSYKEILIDTSQDESIENIIQRTKKFKSENWSSNIAFDEESHTYLHPKDETGNAEYISVTTLIERFFPFDLKRYIEKKAERENRTEDEVLDEYLFTRDEAAEKGTYLHSQIENFLTGKEFDSELMEFKMFLEFYNNEVRPRHLSFFEAEKAVFSNQYNIAGTIDCLFKKEHKNEYVMVDWKRSKKLIIDGRPRIYGYGYALSELNNLDNSSYYRYCLQQNIYKLLIETEYSMNISSMQLVVLHENYPNYYTVRVPDMTRESKIILTSLKHKI
jgi:hypothetical protein